jgi:hypothetical protein
MVQQDFFKFGRAADLKGIKGGGVDFIAGSGLVKDLETGMIQDQELIIVIINQPLGSSLAEARIAILAEAAGAGLEDALGATDRQAIKQCAAAG